MASSQVNEQDIVAISAKDRFNELDTARGEVLSTARDCALLTLPYVLPPDGHTESDKLDNPYQNVGAELVNNLANKITMTMLPPNTPFFRLFLTKEAEESIKGTDGKVDEEKKSQADELAVYIENETQSLVGKQALIVPTIEMMKALLITGNALGVKVSPKTQLDKGLKYYRLDNYVVRRDFRGNLLEVITRETVSPNSLPDDVISQLDVNLTDTSLEDVTVYTRAVYIQQKWYEYQYVEDVYLEQSLQSYTPEDFPYLVLRTTAINGHNYGYSLVAQHLGDFISLEASNQLLLEAGAVAGRVIFGKKAGSTLDINEVNEAQNGSIVIGDFDSDLTVMKVEKNQDLSFILDIANKIEQRLERVFLSANSAVRDSERTTLGEIRYLANDLEQSLGGLYSLLSQEYQFPLARLLLNEVTSDKNSQIDTQGFEYVPITGVEALGRNNDLEKLRQFSSILQETPILQEAISQYFNVENYIEDITVASNLPKSRYIKSATQRQQEQQAQQEQALISQGASNVVQSATTPTKGQ